MGPAAQRRKCCCYYGENTVEGGTRCCALHCAGHRRCHMLTSIRWIATALFSAIYTGSSDTWYGWHESEPAEARTCRSHYALQSQL